MQGTGNFPSIYILRKYLKLVALSVDELGIWDEPIETVFARDLQFPLHLLPTKFPPLSQLQLYVQQQEPDAGPMEQRMPVQ